MKKLIPLLLFTACNSEPVTCFKNSKITCTKSVEIKNPNCAFVPRGGIVVSGFSPIVIAAGSAEAAESQRRERERDCKNRPVLPLCVEWKVVE